MAGLPIAVQLYTLRDALLEDRFRTLERVKDIGYDHVELAGHMGLGPDDIKGLLDDAGLKAISSHVSYPELQDSVQKAIDAAKAIGYDYIVVPWVGGDMVPGGGLQGWTAVAEFLDEVGATIKEAGLQLCYHNHNHEFEQLDGDYIFDILMQRTHPDNLAAELDTYWVQYAGADPVKAIHRYTGRCPLLHIKDMTSGDEPTFAEVGHGIMNWGPIFQAGKDVGTQWYIVEQDLCPGDPLESIRLSYEFMKKQ